MRYDTLVHTFYPSRIDASIDLHMKSESGQCTSLTKCHHHRVNQIKVLVEISIQIIIYINVHYRSR